MEPAATDSIAAAVSSTSDARLDACHRLATLGTLIAGIAHELNNPITYIAGNLAELDRIVVALREVVLSYRSVRVELDPVEARARIEAAEMKLDSAGGEAMIDELIGDALEGAVRVRDLARELLALAREPSPLDARESVDVHEVLELALRLARPEMRHVETIQELRATLRIEASRARLGQVVLNLLRNALQACCGGPSASAVRPRIFVRTIDLDAGVRIGIEDEGTGIDDSLRERLFEPFVTTKPPGEGTGLGLHISRRLIEELGGTLDFRPAAQRGAVFVIELPARAGAGSGERTPRIAVEG